MARRRDRGLDRRTRRGRARGRRASGAILNLIVDLAEPRFGAREIHHEIEALDREAGVYVGREMRTPERIFAWLDLHFGATASVEAASGGIWIASDAQGPLGFCAFDARERGERGERGVLGPIGVLPRARGRGIGGVLLRAAAFALRERTYRYGVVPGVAAESVAFFERAAAARVAGAPPSRLARARTVVLASGSGSNFASVAEGARAGTLPIDIVRVVANRGNAYVLERAAVVGIGADAIVWDKAAETRDAYDARLLAALDALDPELVLLLGWMHVLPASFVARFPQALNLHPAYLPLDPAAETVTMPDGRATPVFRGARAFADALASGCGWSGASVHRLQVAVDRGEIVARRPLALDAGVAPDELEGRLHALERDVVSAAVTAWSDRRADLPSLNSS